MKDMDEDLDRYEQAALQYAPIISDAARRGYRESGRGFVAITLAPDGPMVRYVPVEGNEQPEGDLDRPLEMAREYDPEAAAVVLVLEARGRHDQAKMVFFMELLPDAGGRHMAQIPPSIIGEDESFIQRNGNAMATLAREGFLSKGKGAVVVVRHEIPADYWLVGHQRGKLPSGEGSQMFYVPLARLKEGPVKSLNDVKNYNPFGSALFIFLRPDEAAMTYEVSTD